MSLSYKTFINNLKEMPYQPKVKINNQVLSLAEWEKTINNLNEEFILLGVLLVEG